MLDQLVFMVADATSGLIADRVQRKLGRIGPMIVGWTMLSCLAFLLLPHAMLHQEREQHLEVAPLV